MTINPIIIFAISCLITWLIMGLNARAQDKLLITNSTKSVRLTWQDSNVTALVVGTNLSSARPFLYRVDSNKTPYTVTVFVPVEKKMELFSTVPKFIGTIPEVK